ncbi:MAG: hypothetical protein LBO80_11265 [Treponema sp.]|jgi:hypothetical protein|nr:hypothetical protein [Treponema sp.]
MNAEMIRFGLKITDFDWYWEYGLSLDDVIEKLLGLGVRFVSAYNKYLPGADSAVPTAVPAGGAVFNDRAFRDKLRKAGIAYFGYLNFGFHEDGIKKCHNYAVDQAGKRLEKIDWYIGACPSSDEFVRSRLSVLEEAMRHLDMDGVHLGFMRFPGFWELALPGTFEPDVWPEYCFCGRCLAAFSEKTGIALPRGNTAEKAAFLRGPARKEWTGFKCAVIRNVIDRLRSCIRHCNKDALVMLNTVPFNAARYGSGGKDFFGQDITLFSDVVDVFEVMGYHQILAQPAGWLTETSNYFKSLTDRPVICTVQGAALYTKGMHAGKGRLENIGPAEFEAALAAVSRSRADGAAVFTLSDVFRREYGEHDVSFGNAIRKHFAAP